MPIYDYRCDECGRTYDIFHKVREVDADIVCPSCNSQKHTRLLSAPAVQMGSRSELPAREVPPCGDASCCGGNCGLN